MLARQFVPYPFHITRPFYLDRERRDLATLYLQSTSGGLYRADDLALSMKIGRGAAAHVTTQCATVVHDTKGRQASQRVNIDVADASFLAYTPNPLVLFPGAAACTETMISVASDARAFVCESFTWHDPQGRERPFDRLRQRLTVTDPCGRRLVRDAGELTGAEYLSAASPLGPYRAAATVLIISPEPVLPDPSLLRATESAGSLVGVGVLPSGVGLLVRILAESGGILSETLALVCVQAFRSLAGIEPAIRPK